MSSANDCCTNSVEPDFQGWLRKQGHLVRSWRRRWFVIHGSTFAYFSDERDAAMHANFKGAHVVQKVKYVTGDELLVMTTQGKDFHLRIDPDHPMDISQVFDAFDAAVLVSEANRERLTDKPAIDGPNIGEEIAAGASAEHIQAGLEFSRNAHMPEAVSLFQQATKADPSNWVPHFYLGSAQYCTGDFVSAQRSFEAARARNPQNHDVAVNFAAVLYLNGNTLAAKQILDELCNDPHSATAPDADMHNNLGLICSSLGLMDAACDNLHKAIKHSVFRLPSCTCTHFKSLLNLGDCLVLLDDYEGALGCFEKCTNLDPHNVEAHISLAKAHESAGDRANALDGILNALDLEPDNAEAVKMKERLERDSSGQLRDAPRSSVLLHTADGEEELVHAEPGEVIVELRANVYEPPSPRVLKAQPSFPPPRANAVRGTAARQKASFTM